MSQAYFYINTRVLLVMALHQAVLQQQLIDAQQTIIELQKRIDKMTPKNAPDEEIFWHLASGGIMSNDAANSCDPAVLRKFRQWNVDFARKNIKPYVNPKVYGETVNQMTRGLNERIAELEARGQIEGKRLTNGQLKLLQESPKPKQSKAKQLALIPS